MLYESLTGCVLDFLKQADYLSDERCQDHLVLHSKLNPWDHIDHRDNEQRTKKIDTEEFWILDQEKAYQGNVKLHRLLHCSHS